jgi:hypothetical protein
MELALGTSTAWLTTLALKLIDRPFDHSLIGKEGFDKLADLIGQTSKRLSKPTEPLSVRPVLYAHYNINIQIILKKSRKK